MLIGENCYCWPLKRVWKKVASQAKVSEKSGNLDVDIEWQPCLSYCRIKAKMAIADKKTVGSGDESSEETTIVLEKTKKILSTGR